mmetsp:Transcript_26442/g.71421  ORF Transcript_26442/g.71421 Transcript_26442/m.71421 type:complete len:255 (+) Transcript_26442:1586-2350(+)
MVVAMPMLTEDLRGELHSHCIVVAHHSEALVVILRMVGSPEALVEVKSQPVHAWPAMFVEEVSVERHSWRVRNVPVKHFYEHVASLLPRCLVEEWGFGLWVFHWAVCLVHRAQTPVELARRQDHSMHTLAEEGHVEIQPGLDVHSTQAVTRQRLLDVVHLPLVPRKHGLLQRHEVRLFRGMADGHLGPVHQVERITEHRREAVNDVTLGRLAELVCMVPSARGYDLGELSDGCEFLRREVHHEGIAITILKEVV